MPFLVVTEHTASIICEKEHPQFIIGSSGHCIIERWTEMDPYSVCLLVCVCTQVCAVLQIIWIYCCIIGSTKKSCLPSNLSLVQNLNFKVPQFKVASFPAYVLCMYLGFDVMYLCSNLYSSVHTTKQIPKDKFQRQDIHSPGLLSSFKVRLLGMEVLT
jgi:hypothetical protein